LMACALATAGTANAQPANDDCSGAELISFESLPFLSPAVDITLATPLGEFGACAPLGYSVWYRIVPTVSGQVFVTTCAEHAPGATMFDMVLAVYASGDGTCETLTLLACNDDACELHSEVTFDTTAGTTYYIQAGQYGSDEPLIGEEHVQVRVSLPIPSPPDRWVEQGDAGDTVEGVQRVAAPDQTVLGSISGTLEEDGIDMFEFEICDPADFSATTRGGTAFDTQLFLFDTAGFGVTFNDDSGGVFQSTITGQFVPAPGRYILAVSQYNNDARTVTDALIWANQPYETERAADGPGALSPLHHWDGLGGFGGAYLVQISGAAFIDGCVTGGECPACAADFNQDGGVDGADVEAFYLVWEGGEPCGDVNEDGGVDGGDVETFFVIWENGGC